MTRLSEANKQVAKQRDNIRRYIHDNQLSLELGNRIMAFARHHRGQAKARVHEVHIDLFAVLPQSLKQLLHFEVYVPIMCMHPFFFQVLESKERFVHHVCHHAFHEGSCVYSDELFHAGAKAAHMYFIRSGALEYNHWELDSETAVVNGKTWCCELVLWVQW